MPEPRKFGVTFAPTGTNIGTMTNLTDRQKQVLDFVTAYLAAHQRPPSAWDIANALGLSQTGGVRKHLQALEKKGHLTLAPGTARGIRMSRPLRAHQHPALTLPILGRVAAGLPISAQADVHGEMLLDRAAFFPRPDYLLRVQGDSMRDDGIFDGDLVAVCRTNVADDGQIVVEWRGVGVPGDGFFQMADGFFLLAAGEVILAELHLAGGLVGIPLEKMEEVLTGG